MHTCLAELSRSVPSVEDAAGAVPLLAQEGKKTKQTEGEMSIFMTTSTNLATPSAFSNKQPLAVYGRDDSIVEQRTAPQTPFLPSILQSLRNSSCFQ